MSNLLDSYTVRQNGTDREGAFHGYDMADAAREAITIWETADKKFICGNGEVVRLTVTDSVGNSSVFDLVGRMEPAYTAKEVKL